MLLQIGRTQSDKDHFDPFGIFIRLASVEMPDHLSEKWLEENPEAAEKLLHEYVHLCQFLGAQSTQQLFLTYGNVLTELGNNWEALSQLLPVDRQRSKIPSWSKELDILTELKMRHFGNQSFLLVKLCENPDGGTKLVGCPPGTELDLNPPYLELEAKWFGEPKSVLLASITFAENMSQCFSDVLRGEVDILPVAYRTIVNAPFYYAIRIYLHDCYPEESNSAILRATVALCWTCLICPFPFLAFEDLHTKLSSGDRPLFDALQGRPSIRLLDGTPRSEAVHFDVDHLRFLDEMATKAQKYSADQPIYMVGKLYRFLTQQIADNIVPPGTYTEFIFGAFEERKSIIQRLLLALEDLGTPFIFYKDDKVTEPTRRLASNAAGLRIQMLIVAITVNDLALNDKPVPCPLKNTKLCKSSHNGSLGCDGTFRNLPLLSDEAPCDIQKIMMFLGIY